MEKQTRWPFYLIIAVVILTIYNVLPTVFYYSKSLKSPIDAKRAHTIAETIVDRVNSLEEESESWVGSFCKLLHVKPLKIEKDKEQPELLSVQFKNIQDAHIFRTHLPRAGALIPFVPAQLGLGNPTDTDSKTVTIRRQIPLHFDKAKLPEYSQFSPKFETSGAPTPLYRALVLDRALEIGLSLGGPSETATLLKALLQKTEKEGKEEVLLALCQQIVSFTTVYGDKTPAAERFFSSFSQLEGTSQTALIESFKNSLGSFLSESEKEKETLLAAKEKAGNSFLEITEEQKLEELTSRIKTLSSALNTVTKHTHAFSSGLSPWTIVSLNDAFNKGSGDKVQVISLKGRNPFIESLTIDWAKETLLLTPYADLGIATQEFSKTKQATYLSDLADQLLYNEIASAARVSGETILPYQNGFHITLSDLSGSQSFLALKLSQIASAEAQKLKKSLEQNWHPKHSDLTAENLPIYDYDTYLTLKPDQQKFCLVIYAPALYKTLPPSGMRMHSIYVIAKGMDQILNRIQNDPASAEKQQFIQDFNTLRALLENRQFFGYAGSSFALDTSFAKDFIFEREDYFQTVLKATRENFSVHGTKRYAVLEFSDVEQRLLTENKIDTRIHEDLLQWRDNYLAASLKTKGMTPFDVPKPTHNVYLNNFKLSAVKYFRGDDRKILHWGLDLSGGKTVQIELRDSNHRIVSDESAIRQGINELYNRVNKMGVSEVSIRQEGNYVTLDFPGSQGLSATDLVKASSMYFHVVNEKFSSNNSILATAVNQFLQEIWNEAVVTNHKNSEEIALIAWKHLHGDSLDPEHVQPRSESAKMLYAAGLRFSPPGEGSLITSDFNDTYSAIAKLRGEDPMSWQGQTHPLMIVFRNFALEGSNLDQVQASYDPSKGNFLSFSVKSSAVRSGSKISPRDDFYAWTSPYAKESITGTPLEKLSSGRGWRMAVVLNGSIISSPNLDSPLRDSAMITGSFTQREVNQLEADLKAGSLSFTPYILSEKNVSPELGATERFHGVLATVCSLLLVIGILIGYYRFAGTVAAITVLFTLFLLWATLQNLQATMTLAGIAGIILTLGMAVDANVLVFERIREEFALTGRIGSAVQAGYRKAFSAILDSNVTTLIAAMILLHFDSGPIKGFAVTLIIGIIGSFFASLFTARYFFSHWVKNPAHQKLTMMSFFKVKNFNFLKFTKITVICSAIIIFVGAIVLMQERKTLFGMDFTGGYALTCEIEKNATPQDYRELVEHALVKAGASSQDIQVRELNPSNTLRIFLSRSLQEPGHPFFGMPLENLKNEVGFAYETNPKIVFVVTALKEANLTLSTHTLQNLDKNWTEVSGQMSDTMRNNALVGLGIALLCILIYITIRFEFKYAISATICLAHDLFFTVGVMALLHALKVPIQIDLNTITALMTMIGYSLNDTIIVFDRIREDTRLMQKSSFGEIINHALNVTLSRTLLTSGTTLLILVPLLLLGGSTLFGFSLVMAIGVIFGTLSSLFIAAPLMKYFHDKEMDKESKLLING